MRALDSKVQALRGSFERFKESVEESPVWSRSSHEWKGDRGGRRGDLLSPTTWSTASDDSVMEANGEFNAGKLEVDTVLVFLQRHLEEHQRNEHTKLAKMSEKWEARFTALEEALNSGLETIAVVSTSMSERLTKFMGLAEVLEDAVQRAARGDQDSASQARRVSRLEEATKRQVAAIEGDVACLAQELAKDKAERLRKSAASCTESGEAVEHHRSGGLPQPGSHEIACLARELAEERSQRQRLALEVQSSRCELERLHALLDTINDRLSSLTRAVAAGGSGGVVQPERREGWGKEFDSLRCEAKQELGTGCSLTHPEKRQLRSPTRRRHPHGPGVRFGSVVIERIEEEQEEQEEEQQQHHALEPNADGTGSDASWGTSGSSSAGSVPRGWGSGGEGIEM